jgi:hypothetical protein
MSTGDPTVLASVLSFLDRQGLEHQESEGTQYYTRVNVKAGPLRVNADVYNTGRIQIGGPKSPLKELLVNMKHAIEAGDAMPGQVLPFEIDRFPQTLRDRIPGIDPVIVEFVSEAIKCYRAGALLGAAFMIGAASERAILLLMSTYGESIRDEANRNKFFGRVTNRAISRQYDEFIASYKSCHSRPTEGILSHDMETIIGAAFQFYRITRNDVGHPEIAPDLDKGVILANLGQLVT